MNGNTITYDANGNPLTYHNGTTSYTGLTWEQGRQLASIKKGTTTTSYDYDADGIRSKKTVGTTVHTYVTQNGKVIRETVGSGNGARVLDFIYDNQGRPYALNYSANGGSTFATYYYLLNIQGDVVALMNASGSIVAKYTYSAWGELRSVTYANDTAITSTADIAHINPLRYRGYYYDTETGFYYLQSRYYDPVLIKEKSIGEN